MAKDTKTPKHHFPRSNEAVAKEQNCLAQIPQATSMLRHRKGRAPPTVHHVILSGDSVMLGWNPNTQGRPATHRPPSPGSNEGSPLGWGGGVPQRRHVHDSIRPSDFFALGPKSLLYLSLIFSTISLSEFPLESPDVFFMFFNVFLQRDDLGVEHLMNCNESTDQSLERKIEDKMVHTCYVHSTQRNLFRSFCTQPMSN